MTVDVVSEDVPLGSMWRQRRSGIVVRVSRVYEGVSGGARRTQVRYQSGSMSAQSASLSWFLSAYERAPNDTPVSTQDGPRPVCLCCNGTGYLPAGRQVRRL